MRQIYFLDFLGVNATAEAIFNAWSAYLVSNGIPFANIIGCMTDGAAAMVGHSPKLCLSNKSINRRIKVVTDDVERQLIRVKEQTEILCDCVWSLAINSPIS